MTKAAMKVFERGARQMQGDVRVPFQIRVTTEANDFGFLTGITMYEIID